MVHMNEFVLLMKRIFDTQTLSPGNCPGQPMSEFEFLIHPSVTHIISSLPSVSVIPSVTLLH
jgi:hypothetical protein